MKLSPPAATRLAIHPTAALATLRAFVDGMGADGARVDAVQTLLDTLGCVAVSSRRSGHLGSDWSIPARQARLGHAEAVFRNAYNAHRLELDSVSYLARGHAATVLWPVVLSPDIEQSPDKRLRAYLFGHEVFAYLGAWFGTELRQRGYHPTAVLGSVAGASARGYLQDADLAEVGRRMSVAALLSIGRQTAFASSLKPFQVAWSARVAVESAPADLSALDVPEHYWMQHFAELAGVNLNETRPLGHQHNLEAAAVAEPTHFKIAAYCAYFDEPLRQLATRREPGELVSLTVPDYVAQHHRPGGDLSFDLSALASAVWKHGLSGEVLRQASEIRRQGAPSPHVVGSPAIATVAEPAMMPVLVKPPSRPVHQLRLAYGAGVRGAFAEAVSKFGGEMEMGARVKAFAKDSDALFDPAYAAELVRTIKEDVTR